MKLRIGDWIYWSLKKERTTAKLWSDVAIPYDGGVRAKEDEKVEKYQALAREIRKMWGVRAKVIPHGQKSETASGQFAGSCLFSISFKILVQKNDKIFVKSKESSFKVYFIFKGDVKAPKAFFRQKKSCAMPSVCCHGLSRTSHHTW